MGRNKKKKPQLPQEAVAAASTIVLSEKVDPELLAKWPKLQMKVPTIFLHKDVDFAQHVHNLLKSNINFYHPYLGTNYTRILCSTFEDHKAMLQYFDRHQFPYHTFGHPNKRKLRVVIRGLPKDVNLETLKQELKSAAIPIIRVHLMHVKEFVKNPIIPILAIVPYTDEGIGLLKVTKVMGCDITMEPAKVKTLQCYRCQKWGHTQRYCHGIVKCVKCAGDHYYWKCTRDPDKESPTCANCGGNHTASYRECFYCPDSTEYKKKKTAKIKKMTATPHEQRRIVTMENCKNLYKKVNFIPKHEEAIPF